MSAFDVLSKYGLSPETDLTHPIETDIRAANPNDFFDIATGFLKHIEAAVAEEVISDHLDDPQIIDRWNPGGYMVFALGKNSLLGSVRLNVWPEPTDRKVSTAGPHIHDQAWHSTSLVLAGVYREESFTLLESDGDPRDGRVYIQRRAGDEDVLAASGSYVKPKAIGLTGRPEGKMHFLQAGNFIRSSVPGTAILLTVNSHPVRRDTNVILEGQPRHIVSPRNPITETDIELAKSILIKAKDSASESTES